MAKETKRSSLNFCNKLLICLGMIFVWEAFPYNFFASLESGYHLVEVGKQGLGFYFTFIVCVVAVFILLIAFSKKLENALISRPALVCVAGILETLCFVLLYFREPLFVSSFSWIIIVFAALFACILLSAWGLLLSRLSAKQAASLILLSFALCSLVKLIGSFAESGFLSLDIFIFPILSGACFIILANSSLVYSRPQSTTSLLLAYKEIPWKQAILIALLVYASAAVVAFLTPAQLGSFDSATKPLVGIIGVVFATFILLFQYRGESRFSNRKWWVFLSIASLLVYSTVIIFSDPNQGLSAASIVIFRKCLTVFCWLFVSSLVITRKLPPVFTFCVANLFLYALPQLLRLACVFGYSAFSIPYFLNVETVALACIIIIACIAILVLSSNVSDVAPATAAATPTLVPPTSDAWSDACTRISKKYGLTNREEAVFLLLAKGHTLLNISEELYVSLNTVRSHSKHVYQKMGVNSKQELINAVEQEVKQDL